MKLPIAWILALGCASPPAQLVVVVETDLDVPAEIDSIRVEAIGTHGELRIASGPVRSQADLPATVTLVHRGGPLGPLRVRAIGEHAGSVVIDRVAVVHFVAGEIRVLRMRLDRACLGVACADLTCVAGACVAPEVGPDRLEPYDGELGRDAGRRDGGSSDGGPPPDGPGCPLDAICGHSPEQLPGDVVSVRPCTPAAGVTSRVTSPSGLSSLASSVRLTETGRYDVAITIASIPGCELRSGFDVVAFTAVPDGGRPTGVLRALDARPGTAFVAGRNGLYAVDSSGWHDLSDVATGMLVVANLASLVVWNSDVWVGAQTNQSALSRVVVASDLSSATITDVPLPTGRRPTTAMGIALGTARSDDAVQMAVATQDGIVLVDSSGGTRMIDPAFEATMDLALGRTEPAERGAIWGLSANAVAHRAIGAGRTIAAGAAVPANATDARALAIDDRDSSAPRLWLCAFDAGVRLYDLSGDLGARTDLGAPLAEDAIACADLDLDADGNAWVATSLGVTRLGRGIADRLDLGTPEGLPAAAVARVAVAWDASAREVWVLTADDQVFMAHADR